MAKNLVVARKSARESDFPISPLESCSLGVSIIMDMIDCQKGVFTFAATGALSAVMIDNASSALRSPFVVLVGVLAAALPLIVSMASFTDARLPPVSLHSWFSSAFSAYPLHRVSFVSVVTS